MTLHFGAYFAVLWLAIIGWVVIVFLSALLREECKAGRRPARRSLTAEQRAQELAVAVGQVRLVHQRAIAQGNTEAQDYCTAVLAQLRAPRH